MNDHTPTFLLIQPYVYDFAAYDFWGKPLGLLCLASLLQDNGGEVLLIDAMDRSHPEVLRLQNRIAPKSRYGAGPYYKEHVGKPEIFRTVKRRYSRYGMPPEVMKGLLGQIARTRRVDMILVTSGMTYWYPGAHEAIGMCREIFGKVPILLGGKYATLCADHARANSGADLVVAGEGEAPLLKAAKDWTGLGTKEYATPGDYPPPAYHLYPALEYVAISTSRGCPYSCSFCASRLFRERFFGRDPDSVAQELETYVRRGIRDIAFYDDALFFDAERRIKPILRRVIEEKWPLRFHTPNGLFPKFLDPELARLMVEAGFRTVRLSYESKNPERQKQMRKVSDSDLADALRNLEVAGFPRSEVVVYLIMGLPLQKRSEVEASIAHVHGSGAKVSLSSFSPIPGTKDWETAVRELGFPQDEPLYGNNSVYPMKNDEFDWDDFEELKTIARLGNEKAAPSRLGVD